jgi:hypothetical protein
MELSSEVGSYTSTKTWGGETKKLYHIKFFSVSPKDRGKVPEIMRQFKRVEGVEPLGLFFPRGSSYMYATITKYKDYGAWEKYWRSPDTTEVRQKGIEIITKELDMFFEEQKL